MARGWQPGKGTSHRHLPSTRPSFLFDIMRTGPSVLLEVCTMYLVCASVEVWGLIKTLVGKLLLAQSHAPSPSAWLLQRPRAWKSPEVAQWRLSWKSLSNNAMIQMKTDAQSSSPSMVLLRYLVSLTGVVHRLHFSPCDHTFQACRHGGIGRYWTVFPLRSYLL